MRELSILNNNGRGKVIIYLGAQNYPDLRHVHAFFLSCKPIVEYFVKFRHKTQETRQPGTILQSSVAMLAPSAKIPVRWPSAISLSDSSHGAGNRGSLSPSLPRVGALNIFRAAETGDVEVMLTYLNGGGEPNKTGKVSACWGSMEIRRARVLLGYTR